MVELFANSGDLDQMLHSVASDLGLHCLPITLLGVKTQHETATVQSITKSTLPEKFRFTVHYMMPLRFFM